jgi:hypothetical protein
MTPLSEKRLLRTLQALVAFRFLVLFFRSFLPLTLPEIWRQEDTLGVSLRYWLRWTHEGDFSWLPAILNSGDGRGIMPMEFPFLTILAAPSFAFGPFVGFTLAQLLLFSVLLLLLAFNFRTWQSATLCGVPGSLVVGMLPIFSFGAVWGGKFMPDFLATLFVVLAVGLSWENPRPGRSFFWAALGILIKPTACVVLVLWLLSRTDVKRFRLFCSWSIPALLVGVFYYTAGIRFISRYQTAESRFAVSPKPIGQSLMEFATSTHQNELFTKHLFFPYALFILGLGFVVLAASRKRLPLKLLAVVTIQLLGVAALSGEQGLTHVYYFMGLTPALAVLYLFIYRGYSRTWFRFLLLLALSIHLLDRCNMELHTLYSPAATGSPPRAQCEILRSAHPEFPWGKGVVFRSPDGAYPELGLCFGERENSKISPYGFWWKKFAIPTDCRVVDETAEINLVRCGKL